MASADSYISWDLEMRRWTYPMMLTLTTAHRTLRHPLVLLGRDLVVDKQSNVRTSWVVLEVVQDPQRSC